MKKIICFTFPQDIIFLLKSQQGKINKTDFIIIYSGYYLFYYVSLFVMQENMHVCTMHTFLKKPLLQVYMMF